MSKFKYRLHKPAKPCVVTEYIDGPHPGCSEWAPPDEVVCRVPATHRVKYVTGVVFDPFGLGSEKADMCAGHAKRERALGGVKIYRFRKV